MFSGGFKRSGLFGLIGVFVVVALVLVIALTTNGGQSNPKLTMGLVFAVVAVFLIAMLLLQRSDMDRAARGDARAGSRATAEGGRAIDNPTTMSEPALWAALAIAPIDRAALRARDEVWDVGRRSNRLGFVIVILILLTVPPIYLLESFVPLLIGGPLIVIAALWGSFRAIGPGGEIQRSYERTDRAMAPLGLAVTETPKGGFELRYPSQPGFDYRLRGWTVLSGERHGREVAVRLGGHEDAGTSEVSVAAAGPAWKARSRDGRMRPAEGAPEAIAAALAEVPDSTRWKRVGVEAGGEAIVVTRTRGEQRDWLCDLWLAERLAAA